MNGVTLHAGQTHNQVNVRLMGEHAQVFTGGAVIAGGQEVVDDNIVVEHVAPNCNSKMLYKYVLDDHSVSAFAGKVLVQPDAQHTLSEQTNANLCVLPTAHAYAQPMLEIYADDVKCNHGSTVGKLDEAALFYMRQRGISEQEARLLLQYAFVNEVLQHVEIEYLRERLAHLVEMRFRGEANTCDGCKICK
jgi:Fe-S cluster assembly protein SufD